MNNDYNPRVGFIGAGRVGTTLGRYFHGKGVDVAGFYSRTSDSARRAASFTDTVSYSSIAELISDCNMLFITVPDGQISLVWDEVSNYNITGKCICHCSGAMPSSVFIGVETLGAYGYSIHPLCAVNSITESYKSMNDVFFAVEGTPKYQEQIVNWISSMGNPVSAIDSDKKVQYHAAAVFASNLSIGLFNMAGRLLSDCGIEQDIANTALSNLYLGNCMNLTKNGTVSALTGPVDRNDISTVSKHIDALSGDNLQVYRLLSQELINVASIKNPDTDYSELKKLLLDKTN